jgi:hypothetical protein
MLNIILGYSVIGFVWSSYKLIKYRKRLFKDKIDAFFGFMCEFIIWPIDVILEFFDPIEIEK